MAVLVASLALEVGQLVYSMVPSFLPSPDTTKISIAIGHSDTDNTLGGNAPYVTLYDNNGDLIGDYEPKRNKVWEAGQTSKWAIDTRFRDSESSRELHGREKTNHFFVSRCSCLCFDSLMWTFQSKAAMAV